MKTKEDEPNTVGIVPCPGYFFPTHLQSEDLSFLIKLFIVYVNINTHRKIYTNTFAIEIENECFDFELKHTQKCYLPVPCSLNSGQAKKGTFISQR